MSPTRDEMKHVLLESAAAGSCDEKSEEGVAEEDIRVMLRAGEEIILEIRALHSADSSQIMAFQPASHHQNIKLRLLAAPLLYPEGLDDVCVCREGSCLTNPWTKQSNDTQEARRNLVEKRRRC